MTIEDPRGLSLVFTPQEVQDSLIRTASVVVVDVLRATSVIAQAFASGATRVIPADSVEGATALLASLDKDHTLLCGERDGKKIAGFNLGNSPAEYTPDVVSGKTLIFSSTNGSVAMIRCQSAPEQVLAAFVNADAAVDRVLKTERDVVVVCSGKTGRACLEDTVLGGLVVDKLQDALPDLVLDDGARMAHALWKNWKRSIPRLLKSCAHGAYLDTLGFETDLRFCARLNVLPVAPVLQRGRIERETPPA